MAPWSWAILDMTVNMVVPTVGNLLRKTVPQDFGVRIVPGGIVYIMELVINYTPILREFFGLCRRWAVDGGPQSLFSLQCETSVGEVTEMKTRRNEHSEPNFSKYQQEG